MVKTTAVVFAFGALSLASLIASRDGARLEDLFRDRLNATVGHVAIAPLSRTATIHDLKGSFGGTRISVGRLSLRLGRKASFFPEAAAATSGTAVAENVVITDGPVTYRVKHIELAGTSLGNADLATLFDPTTPDPLETRIRKLDATSISVPELMVDSVSGAVEHHWTQKQIVLANVVAGKAATAGAASGTFANKDALNAANGELESIALTGLDLGQIAHVIMVARAKDDEKPLPLCDSLVIKAVKITDVVHNQAVTIGAIRESGSKGRAFAGGLRAVSAKLANARAGDPSSMAFYDDALHSLGVGQSEMDDITLLPGGTEADPQGIKAFTLSRLAISGFGDGVIKTVDLTALHAASAFGTVAVERATLGDLKLAVSSAPDPTRSGNVLSIESAKIDGVRLDRPTSDGQAHGGGGVTIAHIGYRAPGFVMGEVPARANLTLDHVAFDVSPSAGAPPLLAAMGYKTLDVSGNVDTNYEAPSKALAVDKLSVGAPGVGSLDLKLALANVGNGLASRDPPTRAAAIGAAILRGADLVVRDDGVIDKAIKLKATLDGLPVDQEREAVAELAAEQIPLLTGNAPQSVTLGRAVAAFVRAPKTLHVTLAPPRDLSVTDLQSMSDPGALMSALDVQATANQ